MDVMAFERNRGICVPVPGPMSRTTPEAVSRRGGINADEPLGAGGSVRSVGWAGAVVSMLVYDIFFIGITWCFKFLRGWLRGACGMGTDLIFSKKPFLFVDLLGTFEIISRLTGEFYPESSK